MRAFDVLIIIFIFILQGGPKIRQTVVFEHKEKIKKLKVTFDVIDQNITSI